jgi:hypothetical protein
MSEIYSSTNHTLQEVDRESSEQAFDISIYRYKFSQTFMDELFNFSKIHQYDHRKDFKEAWNIWLEDNDNLVNEEMRKLADLGFEGDVKDKMFKSARYYFRKKSVEKKQPATRRNYIGIQKSLLQSMDTHIETNIINKNYKPSDGFLDFCKNNIEVLKEQINIFCSHGFSDSEEIKKKIKKTYKNRYFLFVNNK